MNVNRQINVNASASELWHILADKYDKVGEWTSAIPDSAPNPDLPEGQGRVCTTSNFGITKETITHMDEAEQSFGYNVDIPEGPFFIQGVDNTWRVEPNGEINTTVFMQAQVQLLPVFAQLMSPILKRQMAKRVDKILEELKYYAETGQIHPRKQEQLRTSKLLVGA